MRQKPPSTARFEAFSDGVIAVIITIIVLELKVPHQDGIAGLYAVFPILLVYLLFFAFTGIYWINHQHLVERIDSADLPDLLRKSRLSFLPLAAPFSTLYVLERGLNPSRSRCMPCQC
ncbi:MAG: TMEM175 family protein [Acidobacteriota bacterium]|nr:TMEM175 family protein [Acidobacteriota bacterium]